MSLANQCSRNFSSAIRARGGDYFRTGRVQLFDPEPDGIEAAVAGSAGEIYDVFVDWEEAQQGSLTVSCSCPHFADGNFCKHIWATLLAVDAQGVKPRLPALRPVTLTADDVSYDDDELEFEDFEPEFPEGDDLYEDDDTGVGTHHFLPSPGRTAGRAGPAGSAAGWQAQWCAAGLDGEPSATGRPRVGPGRPTRLREAWYVIDVARSFQHGQLWVALHQREMRSNGEFGTIKRLDLTSRMIEEFSCPEDRELLALLAAGGAAADRPFSAPYYSSYRPYEKTAGVRVPPALQDYLVPRLCATGRCAWRLGDAERPDPDRSLAWDADQPWRFRMVVAADDQQQRWSFIGQLVRAERVVPLSDPVLLLSEGVVMFTDRLARLSVDGNFPWIQLLRKTPSLTVPYKDRQALLTRIWSQPHVPETDWPDNLRLGEVREPPQPRLRVHPPPTKTYRDYGRLYADVSFLYGVRDVRTGTPGAGLIDAEGGQVYVRDGEQEAARLGELHDLRIRPVDDYFSERGDVQFDRNLLEGVVEKLVERGWQVEAEGCRVRRPGLFSISVTSGVDWFELDGELDFDGVTAQLPELLAAVRAGEKFVPLGDGSRGMLPQAWLDRYADLTRLGETDGDTVRFKPSQALLLDALLAEQQQTQVRVDRGFQRWREKLRSFDGVRPRKPPRGFAGQLRPYQEEGLGWLNFLQEFGLGGCLADDMGLGKTVQVLALLQSRRTRRRPAGQPRLPSLIVVPRSLIFNWMEEAARFAPRLRMLDYTGLQRASKRDAFADHDVILTTYGTLRRDIVTLKDVPFDYAILDESQAIKNSGSQVAKASRLIQATHRLALTGTPVENHLGELWSLFEFLNPGLLGRSSAFQSLAKRAADGNGDRRELDLLARALAPFFLRRTKGQVLPDLPEKTEQTLYCEMEKSQRKLYEQLRDYYRASLTQRIEKSGLEKSKIHVLEALLRLRQAACHPGLIDDKKQHQPSAKMEALLEQIAEIIDEGHKALVFSQFTSLLAIVRERLDKQGLTYSYLDGRTRDRRQRVRQFQEDPDCPLFLISLKAGGHGLNLTAADYVFILDPWWNPAVEAQAVDRAHRIGQQRNVFAYRLICRDTVEEKIIELQQQKRELADAIVSADRSLIRGLSAEDLQLLLS